LTLAVPRTDKVTIPKPVDALSPTAGFSLASTAVSIAQTSNTPLNDFQQAMVNQVLHFQRLSPLAEVKKVNTPVSAISTEQQAAEYLEEIRKGIERSRKSTRRPVKKAAAPKKAAAKKAAKKICEEEFEKSREEKVTGSANGPITLPVPINAGAAKSWR